MIELFKNPNYDFIGKRKWAYIVSIAITLIGLGSLAVKGGLRYDLDFTGGTLIQVRFDQVPTIAKIRASLSTIHLGESIIQEFGDNREYIIRLPLVESVSSEEISRRVQQALGSEPSLGKFELRRVEFVGPQVGRELQLQAVGVVQRHNHLSEPLARIVHADDVRGQAGTPIRQRSGRHCKGDRGDLPGRRGGDVGEHRERHVEVVVGMRPPGQAPVAAGLRDAHRARHRPEVRVGERDVNRLKRERVRELPPVGRDHVRRGGQARGAAEFRHDLAPGESCLRAAGVLGVR